MNLMRIYITHCSAKKSSLFEGASQKVTPDQLYTAAPIQRFMKKCQNMRVQWAIFSDKYGVWFPNEKHEWYEKDPDAVTPQEFKNLITNFDERLAGYDEIWFYHNPGRFHRLYARLLKEAKVKGKVILFTHKDQIVKE
jgi:hypothetical protein